MIHSLLILLGLNSPGFNTDIKPLFVKHCSQCHNQNWREKNWLDYQTAFKFKDKIKARVKDYSMPPGNMTQMNDSERKLIINWVNSGTKE